MLLILVSTVFEACPDLEEFVPWVYITPYIIPIIPIYKYFPLAISTLLFWFCITTLCLYPLSLPIVQAMLLVSVTKLSS